jgi:hypothetical protein
VSALARAVAIAGVLGLCAMLLPAMANAATGSITGHVTEGEGAAITGAEACAFESAIEKSVACATTNGSGEYTIAGLAAAEYKVRFTKTGFRIQWYNHMLIWSSATSVEVTSGGTASNINATMVEEGEGSIAGRVTDASNGQGVGGFEVCASTFREYKRSCVKTGANGEYTLAGLPASIYEQVSFFAPGETCEEEQGEKVRCEPSSNYIGQQVSSVRVKATKTTTVNAALQAGGEITGTVTNASITHPALAKITVCAEGANASGEHDYGAEYCAYTNASGQYTISGLRGGSYKVFFSGTICTVVKKGAEWECPEVYVGQYYQGRQTFKTANAVSVTVGQVAGGINESLREAFPTTPAGTAAPTLTGTPAVGQALSCSQGSWSHEPTYLVYQWLRNGSVISGQTGSTYTVQPADPGHSIACSVTAGNGAGAASAMSNAVAIPVPLAVFVGVKVKGAVASVTLSCPGAAPCSGAMKIVARVTTKHGGRKKTSNVTIGLASFSMPAGKRVTLRVHLTGPGSKLLRRAGRRGLKVQITGIGVQAHTAVLKRRR